VRIIAGSEGPEGEPYRMYPALMNSPGDYNENVFQGMNTLSIVLIETQINLILNTGLDWFVAQLSQFNMTAIMVIFLNRINYKKNIFCYLRNFFFYVDIIKLLALVRWIRTIC
jgi:hypothetical protein